MTKRLLFSYDDIEHRAVYFEGDGKGGFTLKTRNDMDFLREEKDICTMVRNECDNWGEGMAEDGNLMHYAHIPNAILETWLKSGVNINDPKALLEMVNKREWCGLKLVDKTYA